MKSEWFKEWFNTDEYLTVYQHRNEQDAERHIDLILKNITLPRSSKIIDMACGAGRHAVILARKGFEVTGVDLSEKLISIARSISAKENLNVKFILSDIRNFLSEDKFDLVLNLFTSFGYFESDEENFAVLKKAYDLLNDKGFFILDFFNSEFLVKNLVKYSSDKISSGEIIQERKILNNRVIKKITIVKSEQANEYEESVKIYSHNDLSQVLKKIGFDIYKTFGDFDGTEFNSSTSPRVIFVCQK